jgi:hypothetical protein
MVRTLAPVGRHLRDPGDAAFLCTPPGVQSLEGSDTTVDGYLARLRETIGTSAVILLQAGSTALGYYDDDTLLRHKVIRRYVRPW